MNNRDQQECEELTVFREFAKVCPLPVLAGTAQNRPEPEPDILCELESGETLAFELVSCADVISDPKTPNKLVAVTKTETDAFKLELAIAKEYRTAVDENRIVQPNRFEYHRIEIDFEDKALFKQRRSAVPWVIELLNERGPGHYVVNARHIRSIRCRPWEKSAGSYVGPSFSVGSAFSVGVCIVERIKAKLIKRYESNYKIHLLAWSDTASAEELQLRSDTASDEESQPLGMDVELREVLKSNGMGPFDRIWIFGRGRSAVVFDSAIGVG